MMEKNIKYYTDIHSHIIPGVDDGSADMEQSVRMLRVAEENHIRKIILTPHNKPHTRNASPEVLKKKVAELRQKISENSLNIELFLGTEIYYRDSVADLLDEGQICTMADTEYVLVEFSPTDEYSYIYSALSKIQDYGYKPILAHVERYDSITRKKLTRAMELSRHEILLQLNAGSIMGAFGRGPQKFCKLLLKKQLADFVATDAHRDTGRAPYMTECADYLYKKYDQYYVDAILFKNADELIFGNKE